MALHFEHICKMYTTNPCTSPNAYSTLFFTRVTRWPILWISNSSIPKEMYHFAYENTFFDKFKLFIGAEIYITVAQPRVEVTKLIFIVLTAEKYQPLSFFRCGPRSVLKCAFGTVESTLWFSTCILYDYTPILCVKIHREKSLKTLENCAQWIYRS